MNAEHIEMRPEDISEVEDSCSPLKKLQKMMDEHIAEYMRKKGDAMRGVIGEEVRRYVAMYNVISLQYLPILTDERIEKAIHVCFANQNGRTPQYEMLREISGLFQRADAPCVAEIIEGLRDRRMDEYERFEVSERHKRGNELPRVLLLDAGLVRRAVKIIWKAFGDVQ